MSTKHIQKIIVLSVFFLLPLVVNAAEFRLISSVERVRSGDTFAVEVFLDTGADTINALEGVMTFNPLLQLQDIRLVGSVVPLWISAPAQLEQGRVGFVGVLPGGYQGSGGETQGNLFTLIFTAIQDGNATIQFGSESVVYKHDGDGTALVPSQVPLFFTILPASGVAHTVVTTADNIAPEAFVPTVAPGVDFGVEGPVLLFSTQDKNSGVSHYELASAWLPHMPVSRLSWKRVESPHAISIFEQERFVYLRAIDKTGNSFVVTLDPVDNPLLSWSVQGILNVLLFGVLFACAFILARYVRHTKDFT